MPDNKKEIISKLTKIKTLSDDDKKLIQGQGNKIKERVKENNYLLSEVLSAKQKIGSTSDPATELTLQLFSENFDIINEKFKTYKLLIDNLYKKLGELGQLVIELEKDTENSK